ncbi:MAG TPA: GNAT family N-acetyltransferase [Streptosporangiaceae bacterium]|nr:GNAT family N-acetyltransferase [Streptosporangiaceae bacterium]
MAEPPADLEIRPLTPDDDPEAQLDLAERAFGTIPADQRERRLRSLPGHMASGRNLGAFAGRQAAASATFHDMRQWWHGRQVPMAGVAGVMVAPEYRGRGVGRRLMTALLDEIAARGYPLSALYPATMPLYRSLGWELAGAMDTVVVPARSLLRLSPPDTAASQGTAAPLGTAAPRDIASPGTAASRDDVAPAQGVALRRAGPEDAAAVIAALGRVHRAARDCGPITRDTPIVAEWLADRDLYAYLAGDGFLAYQWQRHDLFVACAEAVSEETIRAFWTHIGSHASIADKIYARTGPASAFWWLSAERDADIAHRSRWMLRVVDAPAAIAARGFPVAVSVRVVLRVDDSTRPANSGLWDLAVAGGTGTLTGITGPASTAVSLGARGLAALYAGTPVGTLRRAGLASGGTPADDAALDAAFAATPFMLDAF